MVRLLILLAAVCVFACDDAKAQQRWRNSRGGLGWWRSGTQRAYHPSFGIGIGIGSYPLGFTRFGYYDAYRFDGVGHDPYRYGRFKVPDLLDDPYFQARQRYRNRRRFPPVVRPAGP